MSEPLFSYCIEIAEREFHIEVTPGGFIRWDDYQQRRRMRSPADRHLELKAFDGDTRIRKRLGSEIDEFSVSFRLGADLVAHFADAACLLADDRWTDAEERKLDEILVPLFWSDVNPHPSNPFPEPAAQHRPPEAS